MEISLYTAEFDYGSLLTQDFLTLYESLKFKTLRDMHKNKTFEENHFCTKCLAFNGEIDE